VPLIIMWKISSFIYHEKEYVELRLLIVKHFLLRTMEQCWEETDVILLALFVYPVLFQSLYENHIWDVYHFRYYTMRLQWLYKLPKEPPGKHLYHLFIFCSLLIFRLIWNKYSMLTLIDACTRFSICARPASAGTRGVANMPRSGES